MLYLFCNQDYGVTFRDVMIAYSKAHHIPLTIIFAANSTSDALPLHRLKRYTSCSLRQVVEGLGRALTYGPHVKYADVNAERFQNQVQPKDRGIIAGFSQIFHRRTINRFCSLVNVHPSLLPLYRGPVPSYWCIRNGETVSGYTLHEVTDRIDSGPILFQGVVKIEAHMDSAMLDRNIASAACHTLTTYLDHVYLGAPWATRTVDAYRLYKNHTSYFSFPNRIMNPPSGGRACP